MHPNMMDLYKRRWPQQAPQKPRRRRPVRTLENVKPEPGVYDEGVKARVSPYPPSRPFNPSKTFKLPPRQGF